MELTKESIGYRSNVNLCDYYLDNIRRMLDDHDEEQKQLTFAESSKRMQAVIKMSVSNMIPDNPQPYLK